MFRINWEVSNFSRFGFVERVSLQAPEANLTNILLTLQNIEMSIVGTAVPGLGTSRRRQFRLHVAQSRGFLGDLLGLSFLAIKFWYN